MKRIAVIFAALAMLSAGVTDRALAQSDSRLGTWKLNLAKSTYTPGPPPAKEMRTYTAQGRVLVVRVESVDLKGTPTALQYAAGDDGKDYPMTGLTFANAIAVKRIDARKFQVDTKKDGKVIGTTTDEISKDGKVLTRTSSMTAPGGQAIHNVAVYDKQ